MTKVDSCWLPLKKKPKNQKTKQKCCQTGPNFIFYKSEDIKEIGTHEEKLKSEQKMLPNRILVYL